MGFSAVKQKKVQIDQVKSMLPALIRQQISFAIKDLDNLELVVDLLDMEQTLSRGYSITTNKAGKVIREIGEVDAGEELITRLKKGILTSEITKSKSVE
jgi:exodeoxyribonuclease VII large subunit